MPLATNPHHLPQTSVGMPSAPPMPKSAGTSRAPLALPSEHPEDVKMARLQRILERYEVTIADVNDLVVLQDYDIVFVADDSGSMQLSSMPPGQRTLGRCETSRWDELRDTVRMVAEIACCLDADGIDCYFLNRNPVMGVTDSADPRFVQAFQAPPRGGTPLTSVVAEVLRNTSDSEKPVLMVVATDGEPNGGPEPFKQVIKQALKNRSGPQYKFQILACTADDDQVEWLNDFDDVTQGVDVTDDYHSERAEVLAAGRVQHFRRSDWVVKALLGPILRKYDELDKPVSRPQVMSGPRSFGKRTEKDDQCCAVM